MARTAALAALGLSRNDGLDPWRLAHDTARDAGVQLRPLDGVDDARLVNDVIHAIWGDEVPMPREVVRALAASGNVPWGAFDGERIVGFVLGWAGVDDDGLHVHSHQLATLPDRRRSGVGVALKFAQRAQALEQGIRIARWTFDPMIARNAAFNLQRLGAIADRFHRSFYGEMKDQQNLGERSDRLVVRWDLEREPGARAFDARAPRLSVPPDRDELRARDADAAAAARDALADGLEAALAQDLVPAAFDTEASAYVLLPRAEALAS